MTNSDTEAMLELASEMHWTEAAKYIRGEIGGSMRDGPYYCDNIATRYPDSACALSWRARLLTN